MRRNTEEQQPLIFNTSRNFKRGLYIFNRYRKSDMVVIISVVCLCVAAIVIFLNASANIDVLVRLVVVLVFLLPILGVYLLYMPMPTYFNVLDFLKVYVRWIFKQKTWKWEGIHLFDDEDGGDKRE